MLFGKKNILDAQIRHTQQRKRVASIPFTFSYLLFETTFCTVIVVKRLYRVALRHAECPLRIEPPISGATSTEIEHTSRHAHPTCPHIDQGIRKTGYDRIIEAPSSGKREGSIREQLTSASKLTQATLQGELQSFTLKDSATLLLWVVKEALVIHTLVVQFDRILVADAVHE